MVLVEPAGPGGAVFSVDAAPETLALTTAAAWRVGTRINLERSLKLGDEMGGHLVSGHVDGIGTVTHVAPVGESTELRIATPAELARFIAYKGSITVNGVSLTVNRVVDSSAGCELSINLIPHTLANTTLGTLKVGARVNLEIDLIARYVERMLTAPKAA